MAERLATAALRLQPRRREQHGSITDGRQSTSDAALHSRGAQLRAVKHQDFCSESAGKLTCMCIRRFRSRNYKDVSDVSSLGS